MPTRKWGGLARKSIRTLREPPAPKRARPQASPGREAAERMAAAERAEAPAPPRRPRPPGDPAKRRTRTGGPPPAPARGKAARAPRPLPVRSPLPPQPARVVPLDDALTARLGSAAARKASRKLDDAKRAFGAERFADARTALAGLGPLVDDVPEIRELRGLALYRVGRYRDAIFELEAFRALAGTPEQNPVLADCYRALKRWGDVDELWTELREYSPSAALVNEGRIVMAGSLADRGELSDAIALLEKGWHRPSRPKEHHLRRAYALADLYDRSGASVKARELFRWIATRDRDFADAAARAKGMG